MSRSDTSPSPLQEDGVWSWEFSALTDPGRVRANNEDAVAFDPALGLAILADGMGGYNGGEVASGMALALLQASFGRWLAHAGPSAHARAVRRALQAGTDEANSAILEAGMANLQLQGMGTTLVLAAFGPQRVVIGHIGTRAATGCATASSSCSRATIRCCRSSSMPASSRRSRRRVPRIATW